MVFHRGYSSSAREEAPMGRECALLRYTDRSGSARARAATRDVARSKPTVDAAIPRTGERGVDHDRPSRSQEMSEALPSCRAGCAMVCARGAALASRRLVGFLDRLLDLFFAISTACSADGVAGA